MGGNGKLTIGHILKGKPQTLIILSGSDNARGGGKLIVLYLILLI